MLKWTTGLFIHSKSSDGYSSSVNLDVIEDGRHSSIISGQKQCSFFASGPRFTMFGWLPLN